MLNKKKKVIAGLVLIVFSLILLTGCGSGGGEGNSNNNESLVEANSVFDASVEALENDDLTAFESNLSNNFTFTDFDGRQYSKSEFMTPLINRDNIYEDFTGKENTLVNSNKVIITGNLKMYQYDGDYYHELKAYDTTFILNKTDNNWFISEIIIE